MDGLLLISGAEGPFMIAHGISDNRFKRLDLSHTRKALGYDPKADAFTACQAETSRPRLSGHALEKPHEHPVERIPQLGHSVAVSPQHLASRIQRLGEHIADIFEGLIMAAGDDELGKFGAPQLFQGRIFCPGMPFDHQYPDALLQVRREGIRRRRGLTPGNEPPETDEVLPGILQAGVPQLFEGIPQTVRSRSSRGQAEGGRLDQCE